MYLIQSLYKDVFGSHVYDSLGDQISEAIQWSWSLSDPENTMLRKCICARAGYTTETYHTPSTNWRTSSLYSTLMDISLKWRKSIQCPLPFVFKIFSSSFKQGFEVWHRFFHFKKKYRFIIALNCFTTYETNLLFFGIIFLLWTTSVFVRSGISLVSIHILIFQISNVCFCILLYSLCIVF